MASLSLASSLCWRLRRAACALAVAGLWPVAHAVPPPDKPLSTVADLRYGVALYHYFQGNNIEALTELMVADVRGGIRGHGDNPEIMRGGFNLAYGMERTATEIFTRLLADNRPQATRDAAWFYLARLRYLRGDFSGSQAALANISASPAPLLAEELLALRVNLALQTGQLEDAEQLLADPRLQQSSWLPYLQFNLGAAFARNQQFDKGVTYFNRLLYLDSFGESELALYDKAMTAAGFAHLVQQDYPAALQAFTGVRLDGPVSNRALLGYGWTAMAMNDHETAVRPWQVLAQRTVSDSYTQEALVALPYAFEQMGRPQLALEEYRKAELRYQTHLQELQSVVEQARGHALRQALQIDTGQEANWLNYAEQHQLAPEVVYLVELFADEAFIGLAQELRDLLDIADNFAQWQAKLVLYRGLLDEREADRAGERRNHAQQLLRQNLEALTEGRDRLQQTVQQLGDEENYLALLGPQETQKLERIQRAERNLTALQQAAERGQAVLAKDELERMAEQLRLLKGQMMWHSAELFDQRLNYARRQLQAVDAAVPALSRRLDQVEQLTDLSEDVGPYRQRIARAEQRLQRRSAELEQAIDAAQAGLREQILAVLAAEQQRIEAHLGQARLAIARLQDRQRLQSSQPPQAADAEAEL